MPGFVDCFCTVNLPVKFNTRLENSEAFIYLYFLPILSSSYFTRGADYSKCIACNWRKKSTNIHKCTHRTSSNSINTKIKNTIIQVFFIISTASKLNYYPAQNEEIATHCNLHFGNMFLTELILKQASSRNRDNSPLLSLK